MSVLKYFITSKAKRSLLRLFLAHVDSAFYTREIARLTGEPLNAVRRELGYLEKAGLLHSYMQGNLKYYEIVRHFPTLSEWQKIILFTPNIEQDAAMPTSVEIVRTRHEETIEQQGVEPVLQSAEKAAEMEEQLTAEEVPREELEPAPGCEEDGTLSEEAGVQHNVITVSDIVDILHNEFNSINSITVAVIFGSAARSEYTPEDGIDLLVVGDISREDLTELLIDIEDDTGATINLVSMTRSNFDYRNAKGDPLIRRIWSEPKRTVKGRH